MKNNDLSAWQAFATVAQQGNFTRAASRLGIGAPQLSKKIARLESDLGIRLFQRSTRRVSLTREAQALLPRVVAGLDDFSNLEAEFEDREQISGSLRLTCLSGVAHRLLVDVVRDFSRQHPAVQFEIDVSDRVVDLIDERIDLAIRVQEPEGGDLIYRKLAPNDLVFCAAPGYLKSLKRPIRKPADLAQHPLLFLDAIEDRRVGNTELRLKDLLSSTPVRANNGMFLTELALRGGGVAVRSRWDTHAYLKSGQLVQILKDQEVEPFGSIYAVVPSRRFLASRVRAFLDFLALRAEKWRF